MVSELRLTDLEDRLKDCKKLISKPHRLKDCLESESSQARGYMYMHIVLNKCMLWFGYMSYV